MPDDLLARARAYAASIADKSGQYTAAIYLAQLVTRCERAEAEVERLRPLVELLRESCDVYEEDGGTLPEAVRALLEEAPRA